MYNMENSPKRYYEIIHNYQEAQLLFAAIRMNLFSHLDTPQTSETLAAKINCDKKQVDLLLLSLVSCGLVDRLGDYYLNTPETKDFLSRNSNVFLGDTLLFREKMTSLAQLEEKVKSSHVVGGATYDFSELAKVAIPEMYLGRVQAFLEEMSKLFPDCNEPLQVLDLGGGTGILDIEFVKQYPNSKATIMETLEVAKVTKEIVYEHQVEQKIEVICGDFNLDPFLGPYDLIIASGILNFVTGNLSDFFKKISASLKEGGYLLIIGPSANDTNNTPPNMLSWLSGFLDGIPLPPSNQEIETAVQASNLTLTNRIKVAMFEGSLYCKSKIKPLVSTNEVIHSFIELTEKIANSKTNVLDFGSEDMVFYRGEIHMIKTIGDYPGIHSAKLAMKYGITRPVVHKTLQKLYERGLIAKKEDPDDKKRFLLYLTEKGQTAYHAHEVYHATFDKALFDFLADTPSDQLASIKDFLEHAIDLIQNHA